jgi:hypothetical protein
MGFKTNLFEMEDFEVGEFYVSMMLWHRTRNFRWEMLTVYGPAHHDLSASFISELCRKCMYPTLPLVRGGDLNLIRTASNKNNCNVNPGLMNMFNMFIDLHQLQEIRRSGSKYTWTNKQVNPVMENLDRILVSTEWEHKHPLCFAWSKTRVGSNHWPIFLDSGENSMSSQRVFTFEEQWLLEPEFMRIFEGN